MNEYEQQPQPPNQPYPGHEQQYPGQQYPGYQGHQLPPFPGSQPYYTSQPSPRPPLSWKARTAAGLGVISPAVAIFFVGILGFLLTTAIFVAVYALRERCDIRERSDRNIRSAYRISITMAALSAFGAVFIAINISGPGPTPPLWYICPMLTGW